MSGISITQQQVKLYMSHRKNNSQVKSTAKAEISECSARHIEKGEHEIQQQPRQYRTREDPFKGLFEEHLVPLLKENLELQPITLPEELEEKAPNQFDHSHLRTLQRRVKRWRAKEDLEQEVIFLQRHTPDYRGISDYIWMNTLNITLIGEAFKHKFIITG